MNPTGPSHIIHAREKTGGLIYDAAAEMLCGSNIPGLLVVLGTVAAVESILVYLGRDRILDTLESIVYSDERRNRMTRDSTTSRKSGVPKRATITAPIASNSR